MYRNKNSNSQIRNRVNLFVWAFALAVMVVVTAGGAEQKSTGDEIPIDNIIQSITFKKDMQITDALRVLSAKYHKNIVPSSEVEGSITITGLYDVTFDGAMKAILGGKFEYEQKGSLIEVYPTEDVSRMKYRIFAFNYISAAEAKKLITPVLSNKGLLGVTTAAQTGVPTGQSISAQTGGGDTMSLKDTIVVYDYAENIRRAEEVITAIDIRPTQVLVEATILSAKLTEDNQFGIDWQSLKGTAVAGLTSISYGDPDYLKSAGTSAQIESPLTGGMTVGLALDDVGAFIRAVEQVTDITLLANPKILTVNKQLGQVYIGDKFGYREGDTFDSQGNRVEGQVSFLDTGTKLSFRPYIGTDGYIRMDIHSKDSSGSVPSGIPQETSAELITNIMVKDNQTIVIGGLFKDKITNAKTQVPLLGDIPIIGAVFRGTADKVERQEIVVLLTPHIIEEPNETEGGARADDVRRKRFGAKEELQWVGRARLAEDRYANAVKYYIAGDNKSALHELNTSLSLRPTYLEAIRLKERIINATDPERAAKTERIILSDIDREEADKWQRR